jgi:hypothetical protein
MIGTPFEDKGEEEEEGKKRFVPVWKQVNRSNNAYQTEFTHQT